MTALSVIALLAAFVAGAVALHCWYAILDAKDTFDRIIDLDGGE